MLIKSLLVVWDKRKLDRRTSFPVGLAEPFFKEYVCRLRTVIQNVTLEFQRLQKCMPHSVYKYPVQVHIPQGYNCKATIEK